MKEFDCSFVFQGTTTGIQPSSSLNRFALLALIHPVPSNDNDDSDFDFDDDDILDLFNANPLEAQAIPPAPPVLTTLANPSPLL